MTTSASLSPAPAGGSDTRARPDVWKAVLVGLVAGLSLLEPDFGTAALVTASGRPFLVSHPAQDTFSAVTAICTHEQCIVSTFQSQIFECPCHGSQYSTSGSVLRGPATRPLTQFPTTFSNNVLTITTG